MSDVSHMKRSDGATATKQCASTTHRPAALAEEASMSSLPFHTGEPAEIQMTRHFFRVALLLVCMLLPLTACSKEADLPSTASARISGYNHTPEHIGRYYVDGQWGGNIYSYGGGGSFVCCILYPRQWREGLSAKVRWTTSSSNPADPRVLTWHEKLVPIDRYEDTGTTLNVHFLPNEEVRLIITSQTAGTPGYPGPAAPDPPPDWPPWLHSEQVSTPPPDPDTLPPPPKIPE